MYSIGCVHMIGLFAVLLQSNSWRKTGWVTRRFVLHSVLVSICEETVGYCFSSWTSSGTKCDSFLSGGKFFVTGGTDRIIRVYMCIPGPPTLQAELTGHTVSRLQQRVSVSWLDFCCIAKQCCGWEKRRDGGRREGWFSCLRWKQGGHWDSIWYDLCSLVYFVYLRDLMGRSFCFEMSHLFYLPGQNHDNSVWKHWWKVCKLFSST